MNTGYNILPRQEHVFSRIPRNEAINYSTFDRSFTHLTAFNSGYLIPLFCEEILPGDIVGCNSSHLCRLMTSISAFFSPVYFDMHFFLVYNRNIYNKWVNLMGERKNPNDSIDFQVPMLNSGSSGVELGSIFDYMGIPINVPYLEFSSLPFRCYNEVYNYMYRDENLSPWAPVGGTMNEVNGVRSYTDEFGESDSLSNYKLLKRSKKADYFTTTLPFQQKGGAIVTSLNGNAPVIGTGNPIGFTNGTSTNYTSMIVSGTEGQQIMLVNDSIGNTKAVGTTAPNNSGFNKNFIYTGLSTNSETSGMIADMTNVTGISIADLRTAFQIQSLLELDAVGGTRYKEILHSHFNLKVSSAELDYPEYLGGFSKAFITNPVVSTVGNETEPQGHMTSFSFANPSGYAFKKASQEHGWIIGIASIRGEEYYQQGLPRKFSKKTRYDFFDPRIEHISEQAVKNKEIYAQGSEVLNENGTPVDEDTFGYQEAWAEYKFSYNYITGVMRSYVPQGLGSYHLAQEYNELPKLNQDFVEVNMPIDRVSYLSSDVSEQPQFMCDNYFDTKWTREMSLYSTPWFMGMRLR